MVASSSTVPPIDQPIQTRTLRGASGVEDTTVGGAPAPAGGTSALMRPAITNTTIAQAPKHTAQAAKAYDQPIVCCGLEASGSTTNG